MRTQSLSFLKLMILPVVLGMFPLPVTAGDSLPIGQLVMQKYWVVVHTAPDGLRYTIKTLDGIVVQEGLTGQLLADLYPGVYDTLSHAIAKPPAPTNKIPEVKEQTTTLDLESPPR